MLSPGTPVWVIGLHRSGTSAMAGVLYYLGLYLGKRLIGYENNHGLGRGGFEAIGLARLCEAARPFPSIEPLLPAGQTRTALDRWIRARRREARARGSLLAGKYPHLCFLIPMLMDLAPDSRFVVMQRPLGDCVESLVRRSTAAGSRLPATAEQCRRLQEALWQARAKGLALVPAERVMKVDYQALRESPRNQVSRVVDWLGLSNVGVRIERAVAHLAPPTA